MLNRRRALSEDAVMDERTAPGLEWMNVSLGFRILSIEFLSIRVS